jgi:hypothetical protein
MNITFSYMIHLDCYHGNVIDVCSVQDWPLITEQELDPSNR